MTTASPAVPKPVADKIMILRHGEKPDSDGAPFGVAEDGTQGKNLLLVRGWTRAGGLASLFGFGDGRAPLPTPALARPQHLFACKAKDTGSRRPYDTFQQVPELLLDGDSATPIDVHQVKPEDLGDDD